MDPEETYETFTKGVKNAFKRTSKFVETVEQKIKISFNKNKEEEDLSKFQPNKQIDELGKDIMLFEGGEVITEDNNVKSTNKTNEHSK